MQTLRIAAWSGPRNISTAMMRSWENRADTTVCDEPFYAHYLKKTDLDHPGKQQVLAHHETDWKKVVKTLTAKCDTSIHYQKHMAHHLLSHISRDWIAEVTNIFLIRDPREMLVSLIKQIPNPTIEDTGLPQQLQLFESVKTLNKNPIVLDAKDVLLKPKEMLNALCKKLNIPFYNEMITWPAGKRKTDGIWAKHWYKAVESSTGFEPWRPKKEVVPAALETICLKCIDIYKELAKHKMTLQEREDATKI